MVASRSEMLLLPPERYAAANSLYPDGVSYFPIIASVMNGEQDGKVFADAIDKPGQVYVEHASGFAQVFGATDSSFEEALRQYLFIHKRFSSPKVRLYTPHAPNFLNASDCSDIQSWRQRFRLDSSSIGFSNDSMNAISSGVQLVGATKNNASQIEAAFGVAGRFWRTLEDFVDFSHAVVALMSGQPAAICYAAAVAGGRAETDVLTLSPFRNLGLGKAVTHYFTQSCIARNVMPVWDCFTNNTASMALSQSVGFLPLGDPYPFYTVSR